MRRLTSGPNPAAPGQRHHFFGAVGAVVSDAQPVTHRIEAGQVARHLRRQDQVVGGQRVIKMGTVDFGYVGTERGQLLDRFIERCRRGLITLAAQLLDHPDAHAAEIACGAELCGTDDVGHVSLDRGRVVWVVSGDHLVQQRGVQHCARAGSALVQRRRAGHQTVARHGAVGGFDSDGRGQRGRLADRSTGVGADGQRRLERRQGGCTAPPPIRRAPGRCSGCGSARRPSSPSTSPWRTRPYWSCPGSGCRPRAAAR